MTADIIKTNAGRIEVLHGTEINTYLHVLHNANRKWNYFADTRSLSVVPLGFEAIKKAIKSDRFMALTNSIDKLTQPITKRS